MVALVPAVALVCTVSDVQAQQGGPKERQEQAIAFMRKAQWAEALQELDIAIKAFDKRAKRLGFGDAFGWFWYQKGFCEFQLKEYDKAILSFKAGLEKYPGKGNEFINSSSIKIGECYKELGDNENALKEFNKFIAYRLNTPPSALNVVDREINLGYIYALAATCNFRLAKPNFEAGLKDLNEVSKNRYKGKGVPDAPIVYAFLVMLEQAIATDQPEVILEYLKTNRSIVALEPWRMPTFSGVILRLALDAQRKSLDVDNPKAAQMARVSQEILSLVPDMNAIEQSVADVSTRLGSFPGVLDTTVIYDKAAIAATFKNLKEVVEKNKQTPEAIVLMTTAGQYVNAGAYRQAQAAYKTLHEKHLDLTPEMRENNLYNLILVGAALDEMEENQLLVKEFSKLYPNSERTKTLNNMSLESLYVDQKYEECITQATAVLTQNPPPQVKEMAMFTKAASLFSLGKYKDAIPPLRAFLQEFPNSMHAGQIMYFLESSYGRTRDFTLAIKTADEFIAQFPKVGESPYSAYVRYDRALALINLDTDDDRQLALESLTKIVKDYPDSTLIPGVWVNMALIYEKQKNETKQVDSLKTALAAAVKLQDNRTRGESLYKLISILGGKGKKTNDEAVAYYDEFWQNSAKDSVVQYRLQGAVAGLEALKAGGKLQDGLDKLAEIIVLVGKESPDNPLVEMAVNNYTKEYLESLTKDKKELDLNAVRNHFFNFKGVGDDQPVLTTILRMAVIGVYEDQLKKVTKDNTVKKAEIEGQIKVFFEELRKSFKIEQMTPFALIKVANYLGEKSERPESAIPYYEELLARKDKYENDAIFGLSKALSRSQNSADVDKAIVMMSDLLKAENAKEKPDLKNKELAEYNLAQFYFNKKDYKKAIGLSYEYLKNKSNKKYNMEASMLWAKANDEAGNIDDALTGYQRINSNFTGAIRFSAPAVKRIMELFYKRNKPKPNVDQPSDKLLGFNTGSRFIKLTQPIFDKMSVDERNVWREVEELVQKYDADPEISAESRALQQRQRDKQAASGKK